MGNSGGINLGDNIESLEINGKFDVQIIPSKVNRIELVSGPITMHRDWISHNGSDLSIEEEDDYWFNEKPSYIRIYLNHLNRLEIGSISQVSLKNWKGSNLYISADGASRIDGSLEVNELNLEMDGTAQSEMSGKLSFLQIETDGAADFDGKMLEASNVNAQTDGASQIDVWATANIDGEATGTSSITLKGQPLNANIKTSGAARYKKL
jgi:Putative auto-transporter adhesin, head GIN domain